MNKENGKNIDKKIAAGAMVGLITMMAFTSGCGKSQETELPKPTTTKDIDIHLSQNVTGKLGPDTLGLIHDASENGTIAGLAEYFRIHPIPTVTEPAVTTVITETSNLTEAIGPFTKIPVPTSLSKIEAAKMGNNFPEGIWVNPIYNPLTADAAHNWEGIGEHAPIAVVNIDPNAAHISTHGNVGEIIVTSDKGGLVMVAFMQEFANQGEKWATDENGNIVEGNWPRQYNFHALAPYQEIWVVNPDTGTQMFSPDGSPVIYRANELGIAAFEVPITCGECGNGSDVRFGLIFEVPASIPGTQATEIKIERGANNHPELKGENPLPAGVIKPMIPEN